MKKTITIFAPHPDDETFGCGGLILNKIQLGYDIIIIILTDGRYSLKDNCGVMDNPSPEEIKKIRIEETKKAMDILGVQEKNLIFLDFIDGELHRYENECINKIIEIVNKYESEEIYIPYKNDHHIDHISAHKIIVNSLNKIKYSGLVYQYSISQKYSNLSPIWDRIVNLFKNNLLFLDISQYYDIKENAINIYKSQIEIISSLQKQPITNKKRYLKNREIFYKTNIN